jgi:hypothetical protein
MGGKYERVIELARDIDKIYFGTFDRSEVVKDLESIRSELHELLAGLPEDEPIFVLRGQDCVAPRAVGAWTCFAQEAGADGPTVGSGIHTEDEMRRWQDKYPSRVRVPTTPPQFG